MRVLEATQEKRIRSRALVTVKIVKLTQSGATWYFADRAVRYPWGGGPVVQAEAFLRGVDPVQSSMADLPSPDGRYATSLIASTRLILANAPYRGGLYLAELLEAYPLEGAEVEVIEVAVNPASGRLGRFDLSALPGTSHTPWFRGRVARVEGTDEIAIQLRCESVLPEIRWFYATDPATTDPKDLGSRFPLPVGAAKSVKGVGYVVGWATTLAASLAAGALGVLAVGDATGLPATGTIRVDIEEIAYSAIDYGANLVTISGRGQNGTLDVDHAFGAFVGEVIPEAAWVFSERPSSNVSAVYLKSPFSGEKLRVPSALSSINLADTTLVPGKTVTSLRLPPAAMRSIVSDAYAAAQVTRQPEFADLGSLAHSDGSPNVAVKTGYDGWPQGGTRFNAFNENASSPTWTFDINSPGYTPHSIVHLTFQGSLPDIPQGATTVQLLLNTSWNMTGLSGGTKQLDFWPWGIPGYATLPLSFQCPSGTTGQNVPWAGPVVSWNVNPSSLSLTFWARSFISWASGTATGSNFAGFSDVRLRFGYLDSSNIVRRVDVAVTGASIGYGLEWLADIDGELVPVPYDAGFSFDSVASVSVSGCSISADTVVKSEGAASWKLAASETLIEDFESASGWTVLGGVAVALETSLKTQGSGSIYASGGGLDFTTSTRQLYKSGLSPIDCSGGLLAVDVYLTQAMWDYLSDYGLSPTTGLLVGVTSDASYATHYKQWVFGRDHIRPDEWSTLIWDPDELPFSYYESGTLVLSNVRGYQFGFIPTTNGVTTGFYWDRFRVLQREMRAQLNATAGVLDLSADSDTYRLSLRASASADLASGEVYISNDAGSGTTPPASRRRLTFAPGDVGVGAFAAVPPPVVDVSSPAVDDVETVGVLVMLPDSPPKALIDVPTVWIDDLRLRKDASSRYAASPGTLISRRCDVIRYAIEDLGGDAEGCDAAYFGAADTALGGAATGFGVDLREIGERLSEILVRLAYEARSNLVRVETPAGSRWRLLTADADYEYGAAVRVLTEFKAGGGVVFEGQDTATLRARTFAYYAFDAALGDPSTGGYQGLVGATPDGSDPAKPTAAQLATAEAAYGEKPAEYLYLRATVDEATALDTLGFYAFARRNPRRVAIVTGLSWREAYDLELGDVVSVQPRWRSTAVTGRVIEYVKDFRTQVVNLRLAEVPT